MAERYVLAPSLVVFDGTNDQEFIDIWSTLLAPYEVSGSRDGDVLSINSNLPAWWPVQISIGDGATTFGQLISAGDISANYVKVSDLGGLL